MQNYRDILQQQGLRMTPLRKSILHILHRECRPLTIKSLLDLLRQEDINKDISSVYRQIESLVHHRIIDEVVLHGESKHYELRTHHHHHLICTHCETVQCFHESILQEQMHLFESEVRRTGFEIHDHHSVISGLCHQCQ